MLGSGGVRFSFFNLKSDQFRSEIKGYASNEAIEPCYSLIDSYPEAIRPSSPRAAAEFVGQFKSQIDQAKYTPVPALTSHIAYLLSTATLSRDRKGHCRDGSADSTEKFGAKEREGPHSVLTSVLDHVPFSRPLSARRA